MPDENINGDTLEQSQLSQTVADYPAVYRTVICLIRSSFYSLHLVKVMLISAVKFS